MSSSGQFANYYKVGDTKTIVLNGTVGDNAVTFDNIEVCAFVIGINHNSTIEGENLVHFQIGKINNILVKLVDDYYNTTITTIGKFTMNETNTNQGGWENCQMRLEIMGEEVSNTSKTIKENSLMSIFPIQLQLVMKSAKKYTDNIGGGAIASELNNVTSTNEYLCLPSEKEIFGIIQQSNSYESNYQEQYEYYKLGNSTKYYPFNNLNSNPIVIMLRSLRQQSTATFIGINSQGAMYYYYSNRSYGISPIFFI